MPPERMPVRLLARLDNAKREKAFYETHQIYRTLYHRFLASKKTDEILKYMSEGSTFLLSNKQLESGCDLALLLVDTLSKRESSVLPSESEVTTLSHLHSLMTDDTPERSKFIENVVAYLTKAEASQRQLLLFNELIAYNFWNANDYARARYHFIHSEDGYACGNLLIELHMKSGYPSEVDLFIVQAVLQYLCLGRHSVAAICFHTYTRHHPRLDPGPPFKACPLLNFAWFLLLATAERDKCQVPLYRLLLQVYRSHLARDPDYVQYLQKIGELFFHLPKAKREPSMLSGLLSRLGLGALGALEDEEVGSSAQPAHLRSEDVD